MTDTWASHVLPHSDLVALAPGVWQVTGKLPRGHMPRNMVVARLPRSGGLLIHSAVALSDTVAKKMEALGRPEVLLVPNRFHRLDALVYKQRYPHLRVICPAAARRQVETKVPVDAVCEDVLAEYGVKFYAPAGLRPGELCYQFDTEAGPVLVVCDLLFNMDHQPGFDGLLFRLLGSSGFFGMTAIGRLFMLKDRAALRQWLEQMAALPRLQAVCVGHGAAITGGAAARLTEAAARLNP